MIIKIGNLTLAGEGEEGSRGLRIDGRQLVQQGQFLRATNGRPFARGNRVRTVSFSVHREFDNYRDAETFLLEHAASALTNGTLVMIARADTGAQTRRYLSNAVVEVANGDQIGVSIDFDYVIRGSQMTAEA